MGAILMPQLFHLPVGKYGMGVSLRRRTRCNSLILKNQT